MFIFKVSLFVFLDTNWRDLTNMHQISEVFVVVQRISDNKLIYKVTSYNRCRYTITLMTRSCQSFIGLDCECLPGISNPT